MPFETVSRVTRESLASCCYEGPLASPFSSGSGWWRLTRFAATTYSGCIMTRVAQALDRKLKSWRPITAKKVEKLVSAIIELADAETSQTLPSQTRKADDRPDPFFADTEFFSGRVPKDSASNHDRYLYGDRA